MTARAKSSSIVLPPDYRPSEDEPFMNERQRMYFRQKLRRLERRDHPPDARDAGRAARGIDPARRPRRSRHVGDRPGAGAARPRSPAQARRQDRRRARPHRGRLVRVLRGDGRADRPEAARCAPDRDAVGRGAGAPRAPRARLPRGLSGGGIAARGTINRRRVCASVLAPRRRPQRRRAVHVPRRASSRSRADLPDRAGAPAAAGWLG